jgi:hypothetical protein
VWAGVEFTPAEVVGPIGGFGSVAVAAVWVSVAILRRLPARRAGAHAGTGGYFLPART